MGRKRKERMGRREVKNKSGELLFKGEEEKGRK